VTKADCMIEVCVTDLRLKIALVLVMPRVYDAHKQTHTHTRSMHQCEGQIAGVMLLMLNFRTPMLYVLAAAARNASACREMEMDDILRPCESAQRRHPQKSAMFHK
jgi:hypothetical protein